LIDQVTVAGALLKVALNCCEPPMFTFCDVGHVVPVLVAGRQTDSGLGGGGGGGVVVVDPLLPPPPPQEMSDKANAQTAEILKKFFIWTGSLWQFDLIFPGKVAIGRILPLIAVRFPGFFNLTCISRVILGVSSIKTDYLWLISQL